MKTVRYVVSGGEHDLARSAKTLKRAKKRVTFDTDVNDDAARELRKGERVIVVAHGLKQRRAIVLAKGNGIARDWLWVGMPNPPRDIRLHMYCCHAGASIARHLKDCLALGHSAAVPMPVDQYRDSVMWFLREVEAQLGAAQFDCARAHRLLVQAVEDRLARAADSDTENSAFVVMVMWMLRRSLE